MKNQLDLILCISAAVVGLIFVIIFMTTAPQPKAQPSAPAVDTSVPKIPDVSVVMSNALPGAGRSNRGSAAGGGGGARGGFGGFGNGTGGFRGGGTGPGGKPGPSSGPHM